MMTRASHPTFSTFGEMLRYLRRRARLTQRELSIAVGYSESMISRLEHDERPPDVATLTALFAPALYVAQEPEVVAQLLALAQKARNEGAARQPDAERELHEPPLATSVEHTPATFRLPQRLTSFIGREQTTARLTHLLLQSRLVTLTGPGGCGKTSLAVESARWFLDVRRLDGRVRPTLTAPPPFTDGVCLVELLPLNDPGLLAQTILSALGLEGNLTRTAQEILVGFLGSKHMLLVLDNCEHLIDPTARLVETLLRACPNLRILVTSREWLNMLGEVVFDVPVLAFPDPQRLPALVELHDYAAVQLFIERSQAITPDFRLTPENAPAVAQICALLDGLPLALELAAAAIATFSVQEIAARLETRPLLSSPGYRTTDARHQTLNDTVAWSYNLLTPPERRLLARLAVFVGGWTLDALEAICQGEADCLPLLRQLVQKSLVRVAHSPSLTDDRTRYHLLRAVRDYATERLGEDEEEDAVRRRHFSFYARLGSELGAEVLGLRHRRAMAGLNADYHNVRSAFLYATQKADLTDARAQLAANLSYYWYLRSAVREGASWLQAAIADENALSLSTRALVYVALLNLNGSELFQWNRNIHVLHESERLLAVAETLIEPCLAQGDERAAALLMLTVGSMADYHGDLRKAETYAADALRIFQASNDWRGVGFARNLRVRIALAQGDIQSASAIRMETIRLLEQSGPAWSLCEAYKMQAEFAKTLHDADAAIHALKQVVSLAEQEDFPIFLHEAYYTLEHLDETMAILMAEAFLERQRRKGPSVMLGLALHQLGRMYLNTQQFESARVVLDEAVALWRQLGEARGHGVGLQSSLLDRGQVARFLGDPDQAIACFDESISLYAASYFTRGGIFPILYRGHAWLAKNELSAGLDDFCRCLHEATQGRKIWDKLIINTLAAVGEVARRRGNIAVAAQLLSASAAGEAKRRAEAANVRHQEKATGWRFNEIADFNRIMSPVSAYQRDPIFAAAWEEGEKLSLGEAITLALAYQRSWNAHDVDRADLP